MSCEVCKLIVTRDNKGAYEVWQDGKTTNLLTFGEMLETVIKLNNPMMPGPRYPMRTPDEWDQYLNRHENKEPEA